MRRAVRENALCAFLAGAGCATMAWLGLYGFAWNDYDTEARPSFEALLHGHLLEFLRLVPAYGGSLIERAPFAFLPSLWGGGELAVYRMVALPALLAIAALGVYLVAQMRSRGRPVWWRAVALGVCVANPITLRALELGHPEELLGACLCIAAVLLSSRDRPVWAGVLLGLAIANKEWALLLAGPVLVALPGRPGESRARQAILCMASAGAVAASLILPILLVGSTSFVAGARTVASSSNTIFQPMQVFWFLGHHSPTAEQLLGAAKHDFRLAPPWISRVSHPLVIAVSVPLSWLAWHGQAMRERARSGGEAPGASARRRADALLLLSLLLLLRFMLDTWDNVYYPLPFILALLAWETDALPNPPVLALAVTVLVWLNVWLSTRVSADAQAVFFLVWSLPLAASLGALLYLPSSARKRPAGALRLQRSLMLTPPGAEAEL
jgi:Glycosyltransferase family 87